MGSGAEKKAHHQAGDVEILSSVASCVAFWLSLILPVLCAVSRAAGLWRPVDITALIMTYCAGVPTVVSLSE